MKWLQRQWEKFKAKSFWGKFWDVLFIAVIILLIVPGGREMVQRGIIKTGLMGRTTVNMNEALTPVSKDWLLIDLEGQHYRLSDLNDRSVFLNFWATWCGPCKAEMPSIISLIEKSGDKANFILVTTEDPEHVKAYLKRQDWDLPVYFPTTAIPAQLAAQSLPTSLVINSSGEIIHRSEGMRDWGSDKAVRLVVGEVR